ncbi:putative transmembrane protein [Toxoplasma gondii MAS]|uniref:Putative transmembrane protein n=1 Tax=Toxoplasma gondii MAS TaxID=943118 RepID=A0A086QQA7_TOXGO|nr:putative transmembrane protein [Toxoplasma gondii MAS]
MEPKNVEKRDSFSTQKAVLLSTVEIRSGPMVVLERAFSCAFSSGIYEAKAPQFLSRSRSPSLLRQSNLSCSLSTTVAAFRVYLLSPVLLFAPSGRASAAVLFCLGGLCMLFCMCIVQRLAVMVLCFLLRGAFQNAVSPLTRSIIMDFTQSTKSTSSSLASALPQILRHQRTGCWRQAASDFMGVDTPVVNTTRTGT